MLRDFFNLSNWAQWSMTCVSVVQQTHNTNLFLLYMDFNHCTANEENMSQTKQNSIKKINSPILTNMLNIHKKKHYKVRNQNRRTKTYSFLLLKINNC